jgi:hypothetical protein
MMKNWGVGRRLGWLIAGIGLSFLPTTSCEHYLSPLYGLQG